MRTFTRPLTALAGSAIALAVAITAVAPAATAAAATPPTAAPRLVTTSPAPVVGGYVPSNNVVTAASRLGKIKSDATLPASVDLRADAPPVGNQGRVGSCVAWSIGYSIMGYYADVDGGTGAPYAPLYLYLRAVKSAPGPSTGLVPEHALNEAQKYGVDTQSDYFQGTVDYRVRPTAAEIANAVNYKISGWKTLWSGVGNQGAVGQLAIERALAAGDPVAIGMPVFLDFQLLKGSATYNTLTGSNLGLHMVAAYGYDSEGLWIRNSWSTSWGANGDAKLSWAFVRKLVNAAFTVNGITTAPNPVVPAPTVVSLSATTGSTVGGDTVTIAGTGLDRATSVKFGNTSATFTTTKYDGATRLVATVPAGLAGTVGVTVTTPSGASTVSSTTKFKYVAPRPTVTALSASSSVIFGGSTVTLTGTALTGTKSVKVGSATAKFTVTSDTSLTFVVPKTSRAGTGRVVVTTAGGSSLPSGSDVFTHVNPPAPVVTALSVKSGKATLVTPTVVTGTDLFGATAVTVDGKRVSFTTLSGTQLRVLVPKHAVGTANIQVTTPGGSSVTGQTSTFSWVA
ncbi:IPT/TIG domain-containing protein [Cryptosporangium minutisporangium]|uniref:IPT/TIG domain-containing protein n=1 Tax=Cryptosporangium minutisporangium TaxID=113569 RepID=A0ABP6TDV1_9ACTN